MSELVGWFFKDSSPGKFASIFNESMRYDLKYMLSKWDKFCNVSYLWQLDEYSQDEVALRLARRATNLNYGVRIPPEAYVAYLYIISIYIISLILAPAKGAFFRK